MSSKLTTSTSELDPPQSSDSVPGIHDALPSKEPANPASDVALSLALYREIVESCADAVVVINGDHTIRFVNRAAEAMFGRSRADFAGKPLDILIPMQLRARHTEHVEAFRQGDGRGRYMGARTESMFGVRASGEQFPVAISILRMQDSSGPCMAALIRDVTERRRLEEEFRRLAGSDSLTGALNRRAFIARAEEERERAVRYGHPLAMAVIDIDHFKTINDTFGHAVGDEALKHFVQVVSPELRTMDVFGRWGGEEFILLLPHGDVEGATRTADRLRQKIGNSPLVGVCDRGPVRFTVSIGVAELGEDDSVHTLIQRADQALYEAKSGGRNRVFTAASQPRDALIAWTPQAYPTPPWAE